MEIRIEPGGFLGVDWTAVAAIAALLAAGFTFLLWQAAKGELQAVLEATKTGNEARETELEELRNQTRLAEDARRDQVRPTIIMRVVGQRPERGMGPITWAGGTRYVELENIGLGPAFDVRVRIWLTANQQGSDAIPASMHTIGGLGRENWVTVAEHLGAGRVAYPQVRSELSVGRIASPFAFHWSAKYLDVFEIEHESVGTDYYYP